MLILTRKPGESFWIGDETEIVLCGFDGNTVRIGVKAPRHVVVLRSELKITERQNVAAAAGMPDSGLNRWAEALRGIRPQGPS